MPFSYTNITIFVLFFGIALLEALEQGSLLEASLFLMLGILSLWADFRKRN